MYLVLHWIFKASKIHPILTICFLSDARQPQLPVVVQLGAAQVGRASKAIMRVARAHLTRRLEAQN